jgi:hypothetical protein
VSPQLEFAVRLTEKDLAATCKGTAAKWRWCLIPGVVLAGDYMIVEFPDAPGPAVLAVGAFFIYLGAVVPSAIRRITIRRFRLTPGAHVALQYSFYDDHLTVMSEHGHAELGWQMFLGSKEIAGYVCLLTNPLVAYVIPLASLSADQVPVLREIVGNKIPPLPGRRELLRRARTAVA